MNFYQSHGFNIFCMAMVSSVLLCSAYFHFLCYLLSLEFIALLENIIYFWSFMENLSQYPFKYTSTSFSLSFPSRATATYKYDRPSHHVPLSSCF